MKEIEPWRRVWRDGLAPQLTNLMLLTLRQALVSDDPSLVQGRTVLPQNGGESSHVANVEAACLISYCGWKCKGMKKMSDVLNFFIDTCDEADKLIRESDGMDEFVKWFDSARRPDMRREMIVEIDRIFGIRETSNHGGYRDEMCPVRKRVNRGNSTVERLVRSVCS